MDTRLRNEDAAVATPVTRAANEARYRPYPKRREVGRAAERGGTAPFRQGRSDGPSDGVCLRCGESGHVARQCDCQRLRNGCAPFSVFRDRNLFAAQSGRRLCIAWNIGAHLASGDSACKSRTCPGNSGCHICSICTLLASLCVESGGGSPRLVCFARVGESCRTAASRRGGRPSGAMRSREAGGGQRKALSECAPRAQRLRRLRIAHTANAD